MQFKGKDNSSLTDEVTKDPTGATNTRAHNHKPNIPATVGINNSDIEDRWEETMDIDTSGDKDEIGTLDHNYNGSNDENHNRDSRMTTQIMKYNGNDPNSCDCKEEDMILYKKPCGWNLDMEMLK